MISSEDAPDGFRLMNPMKVRKTNQESEERCTMLTRTNAIADKTMPDTNEK